MSINETVRLITSARDGDQAAQAELFSRLHVALMNIARAERYRWQGNLTMNATAILNEAYIKLTEGQALAFNDRAHFLAIAGKAMRQVLQDYAKSKETHKRGGEIQKVSIQDAEETAADLDSPELLDITRTLQQIEDEYPKLVEIVECRFYAGMTIEETADALQIGTSTVKRRWTLAQSMLYKLLSDD